jgi:hypothetical protein
MNIGRIVLFKVPGLRVFDLWACTLWVEVHVTLEALIPVERLKWLIN